MHNVQSRSKAKSKTSAKAQLGSREIGNWQLAIKFKGKDKAKIKTNAKTKLRQVQK